MTYPEALALKQLAESRCDDAPRALRAVPGVGSGPMGLTPDHVKVSPEYREARAAADKAFREMQRVNAWFCKTYAREYRGGINKRLDNIAG